MRAPAERSADALFFAGIIARVHIHDLLLEQTLNRVFDLNFVRAGANSKNIFVLFLAHQRRLLSQRRGLDNFVRLSHWILSANFSSALAVTKIFWNASNCSVFTSAAVVSFTGLTFRADL